MTLLGSLAISQVLATSIYNVMKGLLLFGRVINVYDREVVGSRPGRGSGKESFSSYQETGKVFSPEMPFYSKFLNT